MNAPEPPERLAVSLRGFAASLIEFLAVRLELVSVEARDEALRLGELLLYGAIAIVLLSLGLTFLAVLLTVLLWDTHRLLALAVFSAGAAGAPKFQDAAAWAARNATGYDALLNSALKGKNAMGPQGGGDFSDVEIGRAVVYMANAGGAKFEEPKAPAAPAADAAAAPASAAAK
jgi:hypothetical protein